MNWTGINQSDIAPLVATLLDINIPAHSEGQVPFGILDMNVQDIVKAKVANGLQLHEHVLSHQHYLQGHSLMNVVFVHTLGYLFIF